ncbi:hypothetical protein ACLOJK_037437 [Asimina triloba]
MAGSWQRASEAVASCWRSGMKMNSLMTGEEDLSRVATVINVGLRPQRIWNELDVSDVMSSSDGPSGRSSAVGSDGRRWRGVFFVAVDVWAEHGLTDDGSVTVGQRALIGGCRWWLCIASPAGKEVAGGSHGCRPYHVDDGAPKVLHNVGRGRTCTLPGAQRVMTDIWLPLVNTLSLLASIKGTLELCQENKLKENLQSMVSSYKPLASTTSYLLHPFLSSPLWGRTVLVTVKLNLRMTYIVHGLLLYVSFSMFPKCFCLIRV